MRFTANKMRDIFSDCEGEFTDRTGGEHVLSQAVNNGDRTNDRVVKGRPFAIGVLVEAIHSRSLLTTSGSIFETEFPTQLIRDWIGLDSVGDNRDRIEAFRIRIYRY